MNEIKMWALDGEQAYQVRTAGALDSELRLEEILVNNPEMLMPDLTLVGRQTSTEGGPLDLLGVDSDGRLVLFELKRGRLSRDAVAQIIDYASDLESMGVDELAEHIAEQSGANGIEEIENFDDWHAENTNADSLDTLLPLEMFLVGLGVDDRTERMVNFLADKGMKISLLTFQGFTQDGKTLLARQVRVDATNEPDEPISRPQPSTVAEKRERLISNAKENGVSELFDSVRGMFHENWSNSREAPVQHGFAVRLPGRTGSGASTRPHSYARIDPGQGQVRIVFYGRSVELCREQFAPLLKEIRYEIFPGSRKDTPLDYPLPEIQFIVTADTWAAHKDNLSELVRAVYAGWQRLYNEGSLERYFERAKGYGVGELFGAVLGMFRESWDNPNESPWHVLGIELRHKSGIDAASAYARIDPEQGQVRIVFYGRSAELCRDEFRPLLNEIRYVTWRRDRKDTPLDDPLPEIQFLVNAEAWSAHKDKLAELARAVYAAYQARHS